MVCPACGSSFQMTVFTASDNGEDVGFATPGCSRRCAYLGIILPADEKSEIDCGRCYTINVDDGLLECGGCDRSYPIVRGVPRLLPDAFEEHPEYLSRYENKLPTKLIDRSGDNRKPDHLYGRTKASFSYEWLQFDVTDKPENVVVFFLRTGIDEKIFEAAKRLENYPSHFPTVKEIGYEPDGSSLRGKLVLDAGCGMGRYMDVVKDYGAEVVGIDVSRAVDRAYESLKESPLVHVVQGNIMAAPFRGETFDFVYSIGVLMLTPDPRRAFEGSVRYIKRGGYYAVWVYSDYMHPLKRFVSDSLRKVTTRLPHKLLHRLCYVAVPLGYLQRVLYKRKITRFLAAPLFIIPLSSHKKWTVRVADTFDWYSPEYHRYFTESEVVGWFRDNGFSEIRTLPLPVNVVGRRE